MTERLERIGREDIQRIAHSFEMFFEEMQRDHGVAFKVGPMRYDNRNQADFKILVSTISEEGEVNTPEAEAYRQECRNEKFGAALMRREGDDVPEESIMQEEWLGQILKTGDEYSPAGVEEYTLLGWKPRAKKYPVCVRRKDGNQFGWTREYLLRVAAANPPQKR